MSEDNTENQEEGLTGLSDEGFNSEHRKVMNQFRSDKSGPVREKFERFDEEAIRRDQGKVRAVRSLLDLEKNKNE